MTTFEKLIKHQDEIQFPIILETVDSRYENGVYYQIISTLSKFKEFRPGLIEHINIVDTNTFEQTMNEKNISIFARLLRTCYEDYSFAFTDNERNLNINAGYTLLTKELLSVLIENTSAIQKYRKNLRKF